jgi:rod shape-determining protein MreC
LFNPYFSVSTINRFEKVSKNVDYLLECGVKNKNLEKENIELRSKLIDYEALDRQYKEVNDLLRLKQGFRYSGKFSKVISVNPKNPYSFIYLDKGFNDGIKAYNPVVVYNNDKWFVIGRINEVYKNYSRVILITNTNFSFISDTPSSRGLVVGNLDDDLIYKYIDGDIKLGDDVFTSAISITFPPFLHIGYIDKIISNADPNSRMASVSTFKIKDINYVYVIDWQPYIDEDNLVNI